MYLRLNISPSYSGTTTLTLHSIIIELTFQNGSPLDVDRWLYLGVKGSSGKKRSKYMGYLLYKIGTLLQVRYRWYLPIGKIPSISQPHRLAQYIFIYKFLQSVPIKHTSLAPISNKQLNNSDVINGNIFENQLLYTQVYGKIWKEFPSSTKTRPKKSYCHKIIGTYLPSIFFLVNDS